MRLGTTYPPFFGTVSPRLRGIDASAPVSVVVHHGRAPILRSIEADKTLVRCSHNVCSHGMSIHRHVILVYNATGRYEQLLDGFVVQRRRSYATSAAELSYNKAL